MFLDIYGQVNTNLLRLYLFTYMMAAQQLGSQVQEARRTAGLSLRKLGKLAGIPATTIKGYESGNKIPADNFLRIADALDHHTFQVDGQRFTVGRSDKVVSILAASEQLKLDLSQEYDYSKASINISPGKITVSFENNRPLSTPHAIAT
jgi:transcriptional regulator with XRE-family HTH domain